jgi:serpin B
MPFHRLAGPPDSVDMMRFRGPFLARQDHGVTAVDLPFKTAGLSLVLVTGTDRPAGAAELAEHAEALLQGKAFDKAEGELAMPKFVLSTTSELLDPLKTMGLKNEALTGLAPKAPSLSQVRQRVTLSVDEKGAEAAAATAAAASRSLQTNFLKIAFDKPFLFALRDQTTGFIIVAGYVGELPAAV